MPAGDHYASTLGALFFGVFFSGCLWGASCVQLWHYFRKYTNDATWLKTLVAAAWTLHTTHQALIVYILYHYTISGFGDHSQLQVVDKALLYQTPIEHTTAFLVQLFFAYRIWHMSGKRYLVTLPIVFLVISSLLVQALSTTIVGAHAPTFLELSKANQSVTPANVAVAVVVDTTIAATMCVLLHLRRPDTEGLNRFYRSNSVIDRLMFISLSTGAFTSVLALILLITLFALPHTFVYVAIFWVIGPVFVNSLLFSLNIRDSLKERWNDHATIRLSTAVHPNGAPKPQHGGMAFATHTSATSMATEDMV